MSGEQTEAVDPAALHGERLVRAVERLTEAVEKQHEEPDWMRIGARHMPIRLSDPGVTSTIHLQAVPGMAKLFTKHVPPSHYEVRGELVVLRCSCGREEPLSFRMGGLGHCDCGRWFLATEESVRVTKLDEAVHTLTDERKRNDA